MRPLIAVVLLLCLVLSGCVPSASSQLRPEPWETGFWFWDGSAVDETRTPATVDVLFVEAGTIRLGQRGFGSEKTEWLVSGGVPSDIPPARDYWLVWRSESPGIPGLETVPELVQDFSTFAAELRKKQRHVRGIQLDIDSPTTSLAQYARFLEALRKQLPTGTEISITALLDWFRDGTEIAAVVGAVDEFVPQFYDVQDRDSSGGGSAIATPIDAERWGPRFHRLGKRYRIGISTFGRAILKPREESQQPYARLSWFQDLTPTDVASRSEFHLQASRNPAGEIVLNYRAERKTHIDYSDFDAGDAVEFVLASPDSILAAVASARRMGGGVAGVVFFRWPSDNEHLTMQPEEALEAAGMARQGDAKPAIHVVDGQCAAVSCVDLYLQSREPLSPKALRYRVRTSSELEYFLPEKTVPARMTGPSLIEASVPPYCGRAYLYLGRAVSQHPASFTVEEAQ